MNIAAASSTHLPTSKTSLESLTLAPRPAILIDRVSPDDLKTLKEIEGLQKRIWNYPDIDIVPSFTLQALADRSGQVIVAKEGNKTVGFAFTFLQLDPDTGKLSMYLDLVGIDPEYKDRGIGTELMQALKIDALNRGISAIEWRYDGLETRNANVYFCKLGARFAGFRLDAYGIHSDIQSDGLPTDRFKMHWDLTKVQRKVTFPRISRQAIIIEDSDKPRVNIATIGSAVDSVTMAVPLEFQALKDRSLDLGKSWILAVRECCLALFNRGFTIVSFRTGSSGYGEYLWMKDHDTRS